MGVLDKKSRIANFRFTKLGREMLSRGKLDFAYYRFFDDGVDYNTDDETIVNDTPVPETVANEQFVCKSSLATVDLHDPHIKPYMELNKRNIELRKQQQIGEIRMINVVGVIDVYVEEEIAQFDTDPPVYYAPSDFDIQAWIPIEVDLRSVEEDTTIESTGEPEFAEFELAPPTITHDTHATSVHNISDPETVELTLHNANVKKGFRVEVFYSGSSPISGSENLVKLTQNGIDEFYEHHYESDESIPADVVEGYGVWFTIREDR
jgi:hypothetical protein